MGAGEVGDGEGEPAGEDGRDSGGGKRDVEEVEAGGGEPIGEGGFLQARLAVEGGDEVGVGRGGGEHLAGGFEDAGFLCARERDASGGDEEEDQRKEPKDQDDGRARRRGGRRQIVGRSYGCQMHGRSGENLARAFCTIFGAGERGMKRELGVWSFGD